MKYALDPHKAQIMLNLCHDDNNIYEVTIRYADGSMGLVYSQAETAHEAEQRLLKIKWVKAAVARLIVK